MNFRCPLANRRANNEYYSDSVSVCQQLFDIFFGGLYCGGGEALPPEEPEHAVFHRVHPFPGQSAVD